MPGLPPDCYRGLAVGQQAVTKGRQGSSALNKVQVLLCVVRLPRHGSDVLLTLNSPIYISERSAAAEHAGGSWREGMRGARAPALAQQPVPGHPARVALMALPPPSPFPPLPLQARASRARTSPRPPSSVKY